MAGGRARRRRARLAALLPAAAGPSRIKRHRQNRARHGGDAQLAAKQLALEHALTHHKKTKSDQPRVWLLFMLIARLARCKERSQGALFPKLLPFPTTAVFHRPQAPGQGAAAADSIIQVDERTKGSRGAAHPQTSVVFGRSLVPVHGRPASGDRFVRAQ